MQPIFSRVLIKDKNNHNLVVQDRESIWNFPGGKQEIGETPVECAIREVKEEIGLDVHKLTEIVHGDFLFDDIQWRGYFYFADSVSGYPFMNEVDKIKEIRFINSFDTVNFPKELIETIHQMFKNPLLQEKITFWR